MSTRPRSVEDLRLSRAVIAHVQKLRRAKGWSGDKVAGLITEVGPAMTGASWRLTEGRDSAALTLDQAVALAAVFGLSLDDLVSAATGPCTVCGGSPPAGFTCNACGEPGVAG
jgi:hypothetical protein